MWSRGAERTVDAQLCWMCAGHKIIDHNGSQQVILLAECAVERLDETISDQCIDTNHIKLMARSLEPAFFSSQLRVEWALNSPILFLGDIKIAL